MRVAVAGQAAEWLALGKYSLYLLGSPEFATGGTSQREEAGIIGLIMVLMTVGVALVARRFGLNVGVRHQ